MHQAFIQCLLFLFSFRDKFQNYRDTLTEMNGIIIIYQKGFYILFKGSQKRKLRKAEVLKHG